ncbi:hypothetical protein [Pedobacter sp. V48]|uniref:hypothetical protein n=1 Tax=Pedobacter sp. V48 TaxID=509635 RepID=UPI0003E55C56|nr:hypothetical protein [Pedobacter sp. V48]ETZ23101.1 hypothetical protein N824_20915 [Pedobacter sp. V48]
MKNKQDISIPVQNRGSPPQIACTAMPKTIKNNGGLPMAEISGQTELIEVKFRP